MADSCPLCHSDSSGFHQSELHYLKCNHCQAVFMQADSRLDQAQEKLRYLDHNNDVNDAGYQGFVSPIVDAVLHQHTPDQVGLDFGAGTGPVIAKLLSDNNFNIRLYDPFFHNDDPRLLEQQYDYIVCCEVMEHFYHPDKEFSLLKSLLKPNGRLYCMTDLYHDEIDFPNWYYQKDNTHVFFYHQASLNYIKQHYAFSNLTVNKRLICFSD